MSSIHRLAIAAAAAVGLVTLPAVAATVSTGWVELSSNNQDQCIDAAERAVQGAGFRATVSRDRQTIFGWRGEEALTVRCIGSRRVAAIFVWVNGQSNDSAELVETVSQALRNPGGGNLTGGGGNFTGGGNPGGGGNLGGGGGGNFGGGGVVKR